MIFEIHAEKFDGNKAVFYYDNMSNTLKDEADNVFEFSNIQEADYEPYTSFDKNYPLRKSKLVTTLKIQLGLSCNYSCDYCSQKFVERAPETSKKDIDAFMEKLEVLEFDERMGLRVEYWGGEPLVYWKTLKPLAEAIRQKFSTWKRKPQFSIITNGSILTDEMIDWLMMMEFSVAISHDGPGQSVRGPDPFDDPETKERILGFYRMMTRLKKPMSFNAMLNSKNMSREAIHQWFINLTGDENVVLGEGAIVDSYDADGLANSLDTKSEHFEFRKVAFSDLYNTEGDIGFFGILEKMAAFGHGVLTHKSADFLGQKCGMDDEHSLAIDLRGNVLTCQNVSSLEISKNGESHLGGNLDDFDNVCIKTSTHWSKRKECASCPVLHLCKGACMFLEEKFWDVSCANAYSDNVALFCYALFQITGGFVPTLIKGEGLPLERQDVFGGIFEHPEATVRRTIPIKVVSEKVGMIDDVSVYGKSVIA